VKAYYLDASAWVKRYSAEAGSDQVERLFESGSWLACAALGYVEVCAAVGRKHAEPTAESAASELHQVHRDWTGFVRIQLTDDIIEQAIESALRWTLRAADGVHLASALYLRHKVEGQQGEVWFVCSDARLTAAAERAGLPVLDPAIS
jgi:hypothetical protein